MQDSLFEYKVFEHATWLKIFHHKMKVANDRFDDFDEALFCNKANKFSILSKINDRYKIMGKYEFLLLYPGIAGYNRWLQSVFPLYENDENGKTQARGFQKVNLTWGVNKFKGLVRSMIHSDVNCIPSLIDGTIGSQDWFYAIGYIKTCSQVFQTSIPGPDISANEVILYIRKPYITLNNINQRKPLFIHVIIIILNS